MVWYGMNVVGIIRDRSIDRQKEKERRKEGKGNRTVRKGKREEYKLYILHVNSTTNTDHTYNNSTEECTVLYFVGGQDRQYRTYRFWCRSKAQKETEYKSASLVDRRSVGGAATQSFPCVCWSIKHKGSFCSKVSQ